MKFDCSLCNGLCCVTPPYLVSKEEIEFAHRNGAKLYALKHPKYNNYSINIEKDYKKDACPFLNVQEGTCNIYENRPTVCREMKCNFMDKKVDEVYEMLDKQVPVTNINHRPLDEIFIFTIEDIKKISDELVNIEILNLHEAFAKLLTVKENYDKLLENIKK